jgi:hypothetical protein
MHLIKTAAQHLMDAERAAARRAAERHAASLDIQKWQQGATGKALQDPPRHDTSEAERRL